MSYSYEQGCNVDSGKRLMHDVLQHDQLVSMSVSKNVMTVSNFVLPRCHIYSGPFQCHITTGNQFKCMVYHGKVKVNNTCRLVQENVKT